MKDLGMEHLRSLAKSSAVNYSTFIRSCMDMGAAYAANKVRLLAGPRARQPPSMKGNRWWNLLPPSCIVKEALSVWPGGGCDHSGAVQPEGPGWAAQHGPVRHNGLKERCGFAGTLNGKHGEKWPYGQDDRDRDVSRQDQPARFWVLVV